MSAVEEIHEAAALMRKSADAASDGPWTAYFDRRSAHEALVVDADDNDLSGCPDCGTRAEYEDADAVHIASWHPNVALAVADWLDDVAEKHRPEVDLLSPEDCEECPDGDCIGHDTECCWICVGQWEEYATRVIYPCAVVTSALTVARAYLGRSA